MYKRRYNNKNLEYGPGGASYIEIWSYEVCQIAHLLSD